MTIEFVLIGRVGMTGAFPRDGPKASDSISGGLGGSASLFCSLNLY